MAVAHDAVTSSGLTLATDPSLAHTPVGTPRAALAFVTQEGGDLETVSCAYGASAMTSVGIVDGSGAAEPARIYVFFLGSSVPTGEQTVAATADGAQLKHLTVYTVTAGDDVEVDDWDSLVSSSLDDPSITLTASAEGVLTYGMLRSGLGNSANVTAGADHTKDVDASTSGDSINSEHRSSTGGPGSLAVAFTTSAADDVVMAAVALIEAAGGTSGSFTHTSGSLALKGGTHSIANDYQVSHTVGSLALKGGTHTMSGGTSGSFTHEAAVLSLKGGTHSIANDFAVAHAAGVLALKGGTHAMDNGEESDVPPERTKMGAGV